METVGREDQELDQRSSGGEARVGEDEGEFAGGETGCEVLSGVVFPLVGVESASEGRVWMNLHRMP